MVRENKGLTLLHFKRYIIGGVIHRRWGGGRGKGEYEEWRMGGVEGGRDGRWEGWKMGGVEDGRGGRWEGWVMGGVEGGRWDMGGMGWWM